MLASTEGQAALARSDPAKAQQIFEQALTLARHQCDRRWEGVSRATWGGWRSSAVSPTRLGCTCPRRCDAADVGDRQWEGNAHCNLGYLLFEQGELATAETHLTRSLEFSRMLGHRWLEATVLCNLGLVSGGRGGHDAAVTHLEAAVRIAHELGAPATEGQLIVPGHGDRCCRRPGRRTCRVRTGTDAIAGIGACA